MAGLAVTDSAMTFSSRDFLSNLLDYIGLQPEDFARLVRHRHCLVEPERLGRDFYTYLLGNPGASQVFVDFTDDDLSSLIQRQVAYIQDFFSGNCTQAQAETTLAIGKLHYRQGISEVWVAGAYEMYLSHAEHCLRLCVDVTPEEADALRIALRKRMWLDMLLQLEGYRQAYMEETERGYRQLARLGRMYTALCRVNTLLPDISTETALFQAVCDVCVSEGGFSLAWIGMLQLDDTLAPVSSASRGDVLDAQAQLAPFPLTEGPFARAIQNRSAEVIEDLHASDVENAAAALRLGPTIHSLLVVPLALGDNMIGTLNLCDAQPGSFGEEERSLATTLASEISQTLSRIHSARNHSQIAAQLERQRYYDTETGVFNHLGLQKEASRLWDYASTLPHIVTCIVRIGGLREADERLGFRASDVILSEMADRLRHRIGHACLFGRLSSNEFAVVSNHVQWCDNLLEEAETLRLHLCEPLELEGKSLSSRIAIGVTRSQKLDITFADLLWQASLAMQEANRTGLSIVREYSPDIESRLRNHYRIREEFAEAINRGQLRLYYQPKVNLLDGEVLGFEALIRWEHDGFLRAPAYFLPIIDDTSMMAMLDLWVIEAAAKQIAAWREEGLVAHVAVNVSSRAFQMPDFPEHILACLQRHHVDPSHFELEILESISLSQVQLYRNALEACQRFGLKLALDDFGTGASTLLHLQSVPAQSIKIDQTFVRQLLEHPNNGAIVASLVSYARFTSRTLIAEGVENHDIQKKLIELGCEIGQGYGIAHPMPPEKVPTWVREWETQQRILAEARAPDIQI